MKRISSQEIQSLELNILKSFKTFAQKNNIIYLNLNIILLIYKINTTIEDSVSLIY